MTVVSLSALPLRWETAFDQPAAHAVVRVRGELDRTTSPLLRDHLRWLAATEHSPVEIDLSRVSFMDVGGHELLRDVRRWFDEAGSSIRLRDPSPAVRRVLDLLDWPIDHLAEAS